MSHTLRNLRPPKLDLNITEDRDQCPVNSPLEVRPTLLELSDVILSLVREII